MFKSYAQNFEDVYLNRVFKMNKKGFYVDIGAHHPEIDSVTKAFYDIGWSGINIEPSKEIYNLLKLERPRDINLNLAISDYNGKAKFFDVKNTGLSTLDSSLIKKYRRAKNYKIEQYTVEVATLDTILADQNVKNIDFLKIDAENSEKNILLGFTINNYRPTMILIESTYPNTQILVDEEWEGILTKADYSKVFFDGLNNYYLRNESLHLSKFLDAPISVFDNFYSVNGEKNLSLQEHYKEELLDSLLYDQKTKSLEIKKQKNQISLLSEKYEHIKDLFNEKVLEHVNHEHHINHLNSIISQKENEKNSLIHSMHERDLTINHLQHEINRIFNSNSWKASAPLRLIKFKSFKNSIIFTLRNQLAVAIHSIKRLLKGINFFPFILEQFRNYKAKKIAAIQTFNKELLLPKRDSNLGSYLDVLSIYNQFSIKGSDVNIDRDSQFYLLTLGQKNEI